MPLSSLPVFARAMFEREFTRAREDHSPRPVNTGAPAPSSKTARAQTVRPSEPDAAAWSCGVLDAGEGSR